MAIDKNFVHTETTPQLTDARVISRIYHNADTRVVHSVLIEHLTQDEAMNGSVVYRPKQFNVKTFIVLGTLDRNYTVLSVVVRYPRAVE